MSKHYRSLFYKITFAVEGFTYIIPVPVAIYFAILSANPLSAGNANIQIFLFSCLFAATIYLILGTLWRYLCLRKISKLAESKEQNKQIEAKTALLSYGAKETVVITLRWFFGIVTAYAGGYFFANLGFQSFYAAGILFVLIAPLESACVYFFTELFIGRFLSEEDHPDLEIPKSKLKVIQFRTKIVWALLSIAILPYVLLSFLVYSSHHGLLSVEDPLPHIFIMGGLMVFPIVVTSYFLGRSVTQGLNRSSKILHEIGDGNFEMKVTALTRDEFGSQTYAINEVVSRLRSMYENVAELNANLEQKVEERTEQLNQTLAKVQNIKEQQDGDYFLTSQLLAPLGGIFVQSNEIFVDSHVQQKKSFDFRRWQVNIGGDLVAAYQIVLQEKKYIAFLNGDCMGKSIQGAGGAVVLGTVFKGLVSRSQLVKEEQKKSPEQWLKECFLELQTVFLSFDGAMMTSAVFGLLDEQAGALYFANAEHPSTVLFRNGEAAFIENENTMIRKIGAPDIEDDFNIQVIQLQKGDIIICGSDGRDDIVTKRDAKGNRIIRADQNIFLQMVKLYGACLEDIVCALGKTDDFVDDLSLLRIEYQKNNQQEIRDTDRKAVKKAHALAESGYLQQAIEYLEEKLDDKKPILLKALTKLCFQVRDYNRAYIYSLKHLDALPTNGKFLYYASAAAERTNRYKEAIDCAERLRLRERFNVENLVHLTRLHFENGDKNRANFLLQEVQNLDHMRGEELFLKMTSLQNV